MPDAAHASEINSGFDVEDHPDFEEHVGRWMNPRARIVIDRGKPTP